MPCFVVAKEMGGHMSIVDLQEVKRHLQYNDNSNDLFLKGLIVAAESVIKNYIRENTEAEYLSTIKQAVLLLIEYWEKYRKDGGAVSINGNYLPEPVLSLLYTYRKQ